MNLPRPLRALLATAFVASVAAAVVAGLLWAYNPEEGHGLRFLPDMVPLAGEGTPEPEATEPEATEAGATETGATEAGATEAGATPTPTPTEDLEALIAAAPDPPGTSVQVLEAGGGSEATSIAAGVLADELGYHVVNVTSSRVHVDRTTIAYNEGREAEARALRARDERFAEIVPNERLHEGIHLHVLVGPDWPAG